MSSRTHDFTLESESATADFGRSLASVLGRGDTVFLSGPLGVGKSALARAVISCKLGSGAGGIPSPSYTLVNVYEADGLEIWHADLYRLSDVSELAEIGLDDGPGGAQETALTLIEWPDRMGDAAPPRRLEIALDFAPGPADGNGRQVRVTPRGGGWEKVEACLREGR